MTGPLQGVRVLDLSHVLNGPFATMLLAHMGADVIKVEYGAGDRYRHSWLPPGVDRDSYEFLAVNANKRAITLNLKRERGKELFRELAAKSDVLVENFSVGVLDRLGLGYEALREINPRLIYASSRGFGDWGPYAQSRAFAPTIMAAAGWTAAAWDLADHPGTRVLGIGDEAAGVSMALGICAALYRRQASGTGQRIEVSMQEALLGFMVSTLHTLFEGRSVGGICHPCADGYVSFHLPDLSDEVWARMATALGHPEALADPRFAGQPARRQHFDELQNEILGWLTTRTRAELWDLFRANNIPAAPVLSIAEVVDDEHLRARQAFVGVAHDEAGELTLLRPWVRFSETPAEIRQAGPRIGEHNEEVYGELLGLTADQLSELAREGVI
jgi:crotonobetainyl-CoA:carnitine CoA-transferase CaiB-like acyl-CoA transferase